MFRKKFTFVCLLFALCRFTSAQVVADPPLPLGQLVDIGSRRLHLYCPGLAATGYFFQQPASPQLDECSKKVIPYGHKVTDRVLTLELAAAGGGQLLYLGARHSLDPSDPEFADFEKAWNNFKPTIAFYEGGAVSHPMIASRDEAIKSSGEPGLVMFLAARDKIGAVSLEPSRQDEVNYLLRKFSAEQVKLFYVLRVIAEDRERYQHSEADLRAEVGRVLDRFSKFKGLENVVRNAAELDIVYQRYWKTSEWWKAPADWFDPRKSSAETGGAFTNEINQESSGYRDLHMFEVLVKAALDGKRVFAIVGRDHVPMQAPALRCALK